MPFYLRGRIFLTALLPPPSPQSGRGRLWGNRRFLPHLSEAEFPPQRSAEPSVAAGHGAFVGEPQVPTTFERSGRPARRRLTSTGSQSHQTKKHPSGCFLFGGRRWIRTIEVSDNRFTVCPLWPLGNSPIYKPNRSWIVLWSWWTASNPRPADYKSAALPAELHQLGFDKCYFIITIYQCQAFF